MGEREYKYVDTADRYAVLENSRYMDEADTRINEAALPASNRYRRPDGRVVSASEFVESVLRHVHLIQDPDVIEAAKCIEFGDPDSGVEYEVDEDDMEWAREVLDEYCREHGNVIRSALGNLAKMDESDDRWVALTSLGNDIIYKVVNGLDYASEMYAEDTLDRLAETMGYEIAERPDPSTCDPVAVAVREALDSDTPYEYENIAPILGLRVVDVDEMDSEIVSRLSASDGDVGALRGIDEEYGKYIRMRGLVRAETCEQAKALLVASWRPEKGPEEFDRDGFCWAAAAEYIREQHERAVGNGHNVSPDAWERAWLSRVPGLAAEIDSRSAECVPVL